MLVAVVCASTGAALVGMSVVGAIVGRFAGNANAGLFAGAVLGASLGIWFGTWMAPKLAGIVITKTRFRWSLVGGLIGFAAAILLSSSGLHTPFIPILSVLLIGFGAAMGDLIAFKRSVRNA